MNVLLNFTISVAFYGKLATLSNLKKFTIILGNPIYFFFLKKIKFWTFWESLLFQSHSTANLLPLAIWKNLQFFFSKSLSFYLERTQFLNVLKILLFHNHSTAILLPLVILKKFKTFSEKKCICFCLKKTQISSILRRQSHSTAYLLPLAVSEKFIFPGRTHCFLWKAQTVNVLLNFISSGAFNGDFAACRVLLKNSRFSLGRTHLFLKKPKLWTFCWILLYQSHSASNLQPLAILKKFTIILGHPIYFFLKKKQLLNILRNLTNSVAFYGKFANFSDFKKIQNFLEKPIYFFWKRPKIWAFWEISCFLRHICNLYRFLIKFKFFSGKNPSIIKKTANFERFVESYHFSRILRQTCYP